MASVYHIVAIHVNETSWAHVWRLRFCYLGTGYDIRIVQNSCKFGECWASKESIVCCFDVGYLKLQVFSIEVFLIPRATRIVI
jgi:hypothetical protein